jgi:SAM-dependent methyltransferase
MLHRISRILKNFTANAFWYSFQRRWGVRRVFDDVFAGQSESESFRAIFRDVFGDEYEPEIDHCGLVTKSDLRDIARSVDLPQDGRLVDLACGSGGAGLWVARETGARLTGVDISPVAVEQAEKRIPAFGMEGRAEFRVGDFAATGLKAASFDGAMSVDALFLVPDKSGSVRETARILRPGSRFVCTSWEVNMRGRIRDFRPLLEKSGFEVERYEETEGWKDRQIGVHQRVLDEKEKLIAEMGESSARFWIAGAEFELSIIDHMRRVIFVARKQ